MDEKHAGVGHVVQVIGPVLDVEFNPKELPEIFNALRITSEGYQTEDPVDIIAEVQQHLGEGRVRAVALQPTDGIVRGMKAHDQGGPVTVPVGRATLGRVMNVLGQPVDKRGPISAERPKACSGAM